MPNYDYRCTHCGAEYDLQLKMADRDLPLAVPCPQCHNTETVERYLPSAPGFGDPMRLGRIKAPDAFNDVLKHIKTKHIHNTITTK